MSRSAGTTDFQPARFSDIITRGDKLALASAAVLVVAGAIIAGMGHGDVQMIGVGCIGLGVLIAGIDAVRLYRLYKNNPAEASSTASRKQAVNTEESAAAQAAKETEEKREAAINAAKAAKALEWSVYGAKLREREDSLNALSGTPANECMGGAFGERVGTVTEVPIEQRGLLRNLKVGDFVVVRHKKENRFARITDITSRNDWNAPFGIRVDVGNGEELEALTIDCFAARLPANIPPLPQKPEDE